MLQRHAHLLRAHDKLRNAVNKRLFALNWCDVRGKQALIKSIARSKSFMLKLLKTADDQASQ